MINMSKKMLFFTYLLLLSASFTISSINVTLTEKNSYNAKKGIEKAEVNIKTQSDAIIINLTIPSPKILKGQKYDKIKIKGLTNYVAPGKPILPYKTLKILIPWGKEVGSVEVSHTSKKFLKFKVNLEFGKRPIPITSNRRNLPELSTNTDPHSSSLVSLAPEQYLRGFKILPVSIHPVHYDLQTKEVYYFNSVIVKLNLKASSETSIFYRNIQRDKELISKIVDNPETVETYSEVDAPTKPASVDPSKSYQYVIITNNELNSSFQQLVNWKVQHGINATVVLLEDILKNPDYFSDGPFGDGTGTSEFNSTSARIRNFIKDAYLNWETDYVLLGGDVEIIPERGVYAFVNVPNPPQSYTVDYNLPCDMYYGALDGSWDNDNDTIFGEGIYTAGPENATAGEEVDFFAEVYVGRAPVNTPEEAENFVNKIIWYENATDDEYFKKALMIGETLDEETEGGNSKDLVTDIIPQYTTTRLYDRDGTFSAAAVIDEINEGVHIINHDGHANAYTVMGLEISDVDNLTNTQFCFIYSLGCYAAAFDTDDAISEHFIFNPTGAFSFIGNTRYGWYQPGTFFGPGEKFDREFFEVLMSGVRNLGKALQISKEHLYSPTLSEAMRWTYLTLVLLGDPQTEIVTEIKAPTAHFNTNPEPERLSPPVFKGVINLTGIAKRGNAPGATFANYTIEVGLGRNPSSWTTRGISLVNNGQTEIDGGVLATWNTSMFTPYKTYTIRLRVFDANGSIGEERWIVQVRPLPAVFVNPSKIQILTGDETFTVEINISRVEGLYEFAIEISWNISLLEYLNHTITVPVEDYPEGIMHKPADILTDEVNETSGTYMIHVKSSYPAEPFDGSGVVVRITFKPKASGICILNITHSELLDKYGKLIDHKSYNGIVDIGEGIHDVAVVQISLEKNQICQGIIVDINVTVENQGSYNEIFNVTTYVNGTVLNYTSILVGYYSRAVISFKWNTTSFPIGNYTLYSNVSVVAGEIDVLDNSYVFGLVTIIKPIYDAAVLDISFNKDIIAQTYSGLVYVTVENQGNITSTFNVTLYADLDTAIVGDEIIIGAIEISLSGLNSTMLTFVWNTTGVAYGNYTISAYIAPLEAEADLDDNLLVGPLLHVTLIGDVDGDFDVDILDAVNLLSRYGARIDAPPPPTYNPNCDIDGDGKIDLFDAVRLLTHYGQKYP